MNCRFQPVCWCFEVFLTRSHCDETSEFLRRTFCRGWWMSSRKTTHGCTDSTGCKECYLEEPCCSDRALGKFLPLSQHQVNSERWSIHRDEWRANGSRTFQGHVQRCAEFLAELSPQRCWAFSWIRPGKDGTNCWVGACSSQNLCLQSWFRAPPSLSSLASGDQPGQKSWFYPCACWTCRH